MRTGASPITDIIDKAPGILCLDDESSMEQLISQRFRAQIMHGEMRFRFARTLEEARTLLVVDEGIDVVLCDINLPDGSGIDFLREIRQGNREGLAVVMVTAYGDMLNIRRCMNLGAFDFVPKPFEFSDLEQTIRKGFDFARRIRIFTEEHKRLSDIDRELSIARSLQESFLPPVIGSVNILDEAEVYALFKASGPVGGDFYDYFQPDRRTLVFAIGDVAGSGIAGAMCMSICQTLLRAMGMISKPFEPDRILKTINTVLCERNKSSFFISLFLGVLDVRLGTLAYCNAGQCLPYLLRKDGLIENLPQNGGMVLGVDVQKEFPVTTVTLQDSETIVLFTDGITEARSEWGEEFGTQRIKEYLEKNHSSALDNLGEGLVSLVSDFATGTEHHDDMTILALKYSPERANKKR